MEPGIRWLVTGGCGFIGTRLIERLCRDGQAVRVLDDLSVGTRARLERVGPVVEVAPACAAPRPGAATQLLIGSVTDASTTQAAARDVDVVVHLAASTGVLASVANPAHDFTHNAVGTLNVLEAARQADVRQVVFASSGAALGDQTPPLDERKAPRPLSPYGASKLAGEAYCSAYAGSYGLRTVALRFGNVYGPGSDHKGSVVARFIKQALAGEELEIYGDGEQTRDFIYIDDLLDAVMAAARCERGGEVFQIASNRETTVNEVVQVLARLLAARGVHMRVRHGEGKAGEVRRSFSDVSKAKALLGWSPTYGLETGLAATLDAFASPHG